MSAFIFGDVRVDVQDVPNVKVRAGTFEEQVLTFAKEWLAGKESFEFQTSGSTGAPKKVSFTREQIKASAQLTLSTFNLSEGNTCLLCLEPTFVAGKMMIVRALEGRMNLICQPASSDPLRDLPQQSVDFAAFVPYQLQSIIGSQESRDKLSQIKKVIVGGVSVSKDLESKLKDLSPEFYETYGMTETLTHIAIRKLNPPAETFQILSPIRIKVDTESCLAIMASHVSKEVVQTNDVVELVSETSFKLLGRRDNIINSAGAKIQPEAVEAKITAIIDQHIKGSAFIISGFPDAAFGNKVVLLIEGPEMAVKKTLLIDSLKPILKKWEVPKEVLFLDQFVRTSSGKINRGLTRQTALSYLKQ